MKKYLCDFNRDYSLGFTNRVHPISHWVILGTLGTQSTWEKTKFSGYMIYVKEKIKIFKFGY